jgi:hypothetical protein
MGTPLSAGSWRTANLWETTFGRNCDVDAGSVGMTLAAHIAMRQCLPQSGIGALSGQHGMPSGMAAASADISAVIS